VQKYYGDIDGIIGRPFGLFSTSALIKMSQTSPSGGSPPPPVLKTTQYEMVTSGMMAVVFGLIVAVVSLGILLASIWVFKTDDVVPLELIEMPGGYEDGAVDETLQLDSPEDESDDPSLAEEISEDTEVEEVLDNVVELADQATEQAQQQFQLDALNTGKPGSASGTGRRPLGMGGGQGGMPREQRWFVRFSDNGTLEEYAEQLDAFGIELGVLQPGGTLLYVSKFTAPQPSKRTATSGKDEKRLYMTWRGGGRKTIDIQLFRKAGVTVGSGLIFHFYPKAAELKLLRAELDYRNKPVEEIRRTYFIVRGEKPKFEFAVTRQSYFQ
jgi:hypothetical protein